MLSKKDRLPIVFTLATSPIMIPQKEMFNQKKITLKTKKKDVDDITTEHAEDTVINKEYINAEIDAWYTTVERAMVKAIPK